MCYLSLCRKITIYAIVKLYSKAKQAEVRLMEISNSWSLLLDSMSTSSTEEQLTIPTVKSQLLK